MDYERVFVDARFFVMDFLGGIYFVTSILYVYVTAFFYCQFNKFIYDLNQDINTFSTGN